MPVKYGKFEMPEKIKIDEATQSSTFARFVVEPFERSFGHTVGNALRRMMLASLEAPAILSVRIEGVPHEYMAVEGVIEDMTHIVLNLKGALLRMLTTGEESHPREIHLISKTLEITDEMIEKGHGNYRVTLKDLFEDSDYEIVNPDHMVFTATKPMTKRIDLRISSGRGYVPSERHANFDRVVDEIVIDSAFSPVRLVNYYVENTRVGQDTDYDRLILEVTTDGRITPIEALTFAAQIGIMHFEVFGAIKQHTIVLEKGEIQTNRDRDEVLSKLSLKINEIELSVRSTNCLANANIDTIGELVVMPESEMLRFRNFGKKSLTEIKQKLDELGLALGMDLSRYGINRDNIKQVIQNYLSEKAGETIV
ncbi:MAG: DNA-directed RNA polymerase subunit alpha [Verrucomicrobia bacterium]|nr:DNA-directed RNA polymerase subunit alpha [Verrucomicrobiota bacterium]MBU6446192.1 DNA-directed RNA polymerase subunit alpha [Verrucomicrobiota bacterium]MDE3046770.1 DNA-directed RNA polymerase subunit alpha [Verrucomicrobiota bacterium]